MGFHGYENDGYVLLGIVNILEKHAVSIFRDDTAVFASGASFLRLGKHFFLTYLRLHILYVGGMEKHMKNFSPKTEKFT